jgi:RNA polymerase sigma-70 factor (ECF subfamily)
MNLREISMAAKFKRGDPTAFRGIYDSHSARVMGYLTRLTGNRSEAEDLLQEVFVAAYQNRDSLREHDRLLSWLLGIAARRWRDRHRRHELPITAMDNVDIDRIAVPTGQSPVENQVIAAVTLDEAMMRLEPAFREAVLLVTGQGLTYVEAAAVTGEPVGTVKWRVSVATRRLQQLLSDIAIEPSTAPEGAQQGGSPWRVLT